LTEVRTALRGRYPDKLYRGTSLIRNRHPVGPYRRNMPRLLWRSTGGGGFLISEVPLYNEFEMAVFNLLVPEVLS